MIRFIKNPAHNAGVTHPGGGYQLDWRPSNRRAVKQALKMFQEAGWKSEFAPRFRDKQFGALSELFTVKKTNPAVGLSCEVSLECWYGYQGEWKTRWNWNFDFQKYMNALVKTWPKELYARVVDAEEYGGIMFGNGHYQDVATDKHLKWLATEMPILAAYYCAGMIDRLSP